MYRHPTDSSWSTCCLVCAPSAMTSSSSLMASTLESLSMFSDEYADPKSSISTAMLSACSLRMVLSTLDRFLATALSVISAWSSRASTSYSFSSPVSVSATSIWSMSTMETFTEIGTRLRPSRSQRASIRTTERHTNMSSREIWPACSSMGTNLPGDTTPYLGWFQRTSASAPTMAPVAALHLGCR